MTAAVDNRGMVEQERIGWRADLPRLLEEIAANWRLTIGPPFPALSWNYAAPASRDGEQLALKVCLPGYPYQSEAAAMTLYDGKGVVRLIEVDHARRALLLERALPGASIRSLPDEESTQIAAETMRTLWRPARNDGPFETLEGWFGGFAKHRQRFGGSGLIDSVLFERGERLFADLLASQEERVVLHGDFHHENLLSSARGWLAIDAKGVIGEPAYEPANWIRNPRGIQEWPNLRQVTARRLDQFAEILGIDRARIRDWAIAQLMLSACWFLEDDSPGWRSDVAIVELLLDL
jgi:streptomycin 6-kinase